MADSERHPERANPHHAAILLIDVINDFDFAGAPSLLAQAVPAAEAIRQLRGAAAGRAGRLRER